MLIKRLIYFLIFIFSSLAFFSFSEKNHLLNISFYSEQFSIMYHSEMLDTYTIRNLEEQAIVDYYQQLEEVPYEIFTHSIRSYQNQYNLNDWLVYELLMESIKAIYSDKSRKEKNLIAWFMLSKLGYDTRLAFLKDEVYIYAKIEEDIYETPLIEDGKYKFAGLTEMQQKRTKKNKAVYLLNYLATPNGKSFDFSLRELPKLNPQIQNKDFKFTWRGFDYIVPVQYDKTLVNIMRKYPVISETDYLKTPFSVNLKKTLLPPLKKILKGRPEVEALEILASFTRSAFRYKEDEQYFNRSKPMIRDEVFFYPYSDCEDRSAVFYGLVEELLDLPMIVVAFSDHLTIAVALDQPIGPSIRYRGKKFYICDPTGPSNSSEIGRPPKGYANQPFEILMDNF